MNLFPAENYDDSDNYEDITDDELDWKPNWLFNFETGEFEIEPNGTIKTCSREESYIQWCNKALATPRFKMGYSFNYGQEFKKLIGSSMDKKAIELEIIRMITDCLMVHPLTREVTSFSFIWKNNGSIVDVDFSIITIEQANFIMNKTITL